MTQFMVEIDIRAGFFTLFESESKKHKYFRYVMLCYLELRFFYVMLCYFINIKYLCYVIYVMLLT